MATDSTTSSSLSERDREHLAGAFREAGVVHAQIPSLAAQAHFAWALWESFRRPIVWVLDGPRTLDIFHENLLTLAQGREHSTAYYPAWEALPGQAAPLNPDLVGDRLATLLRCLGQEAPRIVATSVQALMQKTLSPSALNRKSFRMALTDEIELDVLSSRLQKNGYDFQPQVAAKGQASIRGGLVDVWPPHETWPLRFEFFGPVLESIRLFDPANQVSLAKKTACMLLPAAEWISSDETSLAGDLFSFIEPDSMWAWSDPENLKHHADLYEGLIRQMDASAYTLSYRSVQNRIRKIKDSHLIHLSNEAGRTDVHALDYTPADGVPNIKIDGLHPDAMEETRAAYISNLKQCAAKGEDVRIFFNTEGGRDRFKEIYLPDANAPASLQLHLGQLSEGFRCDTSNLTVVAEADLYGRQKEVRGRYDLHARRPGPKRIQTAKIESWTDMEPGDYVVHVDHGIGRYRGLFEIDSHGQKQEALSIEYAGGAKLHLPVAQAHLLGRYVGVGGRAPKLHALGSKRWQREKVAAEKAVQDLAGHLLETQAVRDALEGHAFTIDTSWQHEFEGAFPFQETEDQHRAIREVKADMENLRPMDRLICGDVGYGKTEVAMRAAFKAVMGGKQVAVLVPTTILAQQHYDTFASRMIAFPVTIEVLSRFQTRGEQQESVKRAAEGRVDILIGTHRLIQDDVRFKDLGLVIIDEEQRFGVEQKERLKQLRQLVDVLTMTATPIPRTLYMSLTGARDMSTIQTPPQERLPITTVVSENTDDVVRDAILREINREGQVFYLHNRVATIAKVADRLKRIVPEVKVAVGHGQMNEKQLASVMRLFVQGDIDVLLCTTIIESGVDIPNVNTILIDRADRFGMADLYQLRGRVGRYKHQAYAYLLLPRHGRLFDTARKRIGAIRQYSSLGAGFKLALKDLEIRGAGNLLGAEQSGHIAAVGFDLYCQLLKRSVAHLQGAPLPPVINVEMQLDFIDLSISHTDDDRSAVFPVDYIEEENLRVALYRKISIASSLDEIEEIQDELRDRFGPLPEAVERLLNIARVRIHAAIRGIESLDVRGPKVLMMKDGDYIMKNKRHPRLSSTTATEKLNEMMEIVQNF